MLYVIVCVQNENYIIINSKFQKTSRKISINQIHLKTDCKINYLLRKKIQQNKKKHLINCKRTHFVIISSNIII